MWFRPLSVGRRGLFRKGEVVFWGENHYFVCRKADLLMRYNYICIDYQ